MPPEATLTELHLLPRVQYVLLADTQYEVTIPNPVAGLDPLTDLSLLGVPEDPLRILAYWPNKDSPLEDLVVLRGDDKRLSVRAEVSGGRGDVAVWWMIDGRVNHEGLESD